MKRADGRGSGVVRLRPEDDNDNTLKAWTLLTALDEIKGHEEQLGRSRPQGKAYSRDFRGPNWFDIRRAAAEYADRDPAVLVVGGGQAGLSIAACLTQLGIDTLIVDREPRIGDNWRKRYHALVLHNQVHVNHLPYMRFPPNWPAYIPKDKIAGWFEAYVESMELNYWTATEFEGGSYDDKTQRWSVVLRGRRRLEARDAPAARGSGHRRQRYSEPSGYSDIAQFLRNDPALEPIQRRRGLEGKECACHRLGQ